VPMGNSQATAGSSEGVDGVDGEELAEGVGEPQLGGEIEWADALWVSVHGGREGHHQVGEEGGEEGQVRGGIVGDVGVEELQRAELERREVGSGDGPVLLPEVLEVVKAATSAPAGEVALASFPAGGGWGAGSVGRGGEVGGEGAGLEEGVEARLAGGAQGLKALCPHHLQPCRGVDGEGSCLCGLVISAT
jgi:hypothetical protein